MDKFRLEYELKRRGFSVKDLCKIIGIDKSTYYRKCNGKSDFTQREIQVIMKWLHLDTPMDIFFTREVS